MAFRSGGASKVLWVTDDGVSSRNHDAYVTELIALCRARSVCFEQLLLVALVTRSLSDDAAVHERVDNRAGLIDADGELFREKDGRLLFRPGGHGALIENLNDLGEEIVFIKNIDNIVPETKADTTIQYKKVLAGLLLHLQQRTFDYLEMLDEGAVSDEELDEIADFAKNDLMIDIPDFVKDYTNIEKVDYLYNKLNRPMRVCGMVKNEGEPGGGPFWVKNDDDEVSLQIIESSQIDHGNASQESVFQASTHFNPVDLVCGCWNYKGEAFNLTDYVDANTGFVSNKSKDGRELKALELPGLWNGAMADWITVFVEVPIETFNPVKTVNDLLKPMHN